MRGSVLAKAHVQRPFNRLLRTLKPGLASVLAVLLLVAAANHSDALTPTSDTPVPIEKPTFDPDGNIIVLNTLDNGLAAIDAGNYEEASDIHAALPAGSLDRKILAWRMATAPRANLPLATLTKLAAELDHWPVQSGLRANLERAIYRQNPDPRLVLRVFAENPPDTMAGRIAHARALQRSGDTDNAAELVRSIWYDTTLDTGTAAHFAQEFEQYLGSDQHLLRMKKLLYRDQIRAALIPARKAGAELLYQAWVQTIRAPARAMTAINAAEKSFKDDATLIYLKVRHFRNLDNTDEAARLLLTMPTDKAELIAPEEWWVEQRIISRDLFEKGDADRAYLVAAAHQAAHPKIAGEAEFHAGWYALRGLDQPLLARTHFRSLLQWAETGNQRARAYYWLARTHAGETATGPNAQAAKLYAQAARFPTTYYGQLAAAMTNQPLPSFAEPEITPEFSTRHEANPVIKAIARLREIGADPLADLLSREQARTSKKPAEIALLARDARRRGDHRLALQIGRIGLSRGLEVAALAYPLGALPETANTTKTGHALAYAVARQESAFHVAAVSPANARGLLQLLPGTAHGVASRLALTYSPQRLTTDAAYNTTLGAQYLAEQIDRFDGSYILTLVAYNAGPSRVTEWIARFGDPRGKPLEDVVDWVEKIPYPETRDYVQRVLENYQVYKSRLEQTADIATDLRLGRTGN